MTLHANLAPSARHAPHSWEYANAAARTSATGFTAGDVHKVALQADDHSLWVLADATPTWVQVGGPTVSTGTFTPTLYGATSAGTPTYSVQQGTYMKIGSYVFFHAYITTSAHTGTGTTMIGGLPFTAANIAVQPNLSTFAQFQAWSASGYPSLQSKVVPNTSTIEVSAAGTDAWYGVPIDANGGTISVSGHYIAA